MLTRKRTAGLLGVLCIGGLLAGALGFILSSRGPNPIGRLALEEAAALIAAHPVRDAGINSLEVADWICNRLPDPTRAERLPFDTSRGPMVNVLYRPTDEKPVAVFISHFDTKPGIPNFVGANDGASTTGLLIAMAHHTKLPVWYLFLDGEECLTSYSGDDGLHGSWEMARSGRLAKDIPIIVVDMLGDKDFGPELANNASPWLNHKLLQAAEKTDYPLVQIGNMIDDHVPFVACGYRAANVIDFNFGPDHAWWHSSEDTLDKLSADSLAKTADFLEAAVQILEKETK